MPNTYLDSLTGAATPTPSQLASRIGEHVAQRILASQASQQASLVRPHFTTTTLTASEVEAAMRKVGEHPKELWIVTRTYQQDESPQLEKSKNKWTGFKTKELALQAMVESVKRENREAYIRINDYMDEIGHNKAYLAKLDQLASELAASSSSS